MSVLQSVWEWIAADLIRAFSLLTSVFLGVIAFLQWKEARRLRKIEEGRWAEEKRERADLVARISSSGKNRKLQVENRGEAAVKNICVIANGKLLHDVDGFLTSLAENPIDRIGPGASYEFDLTPDESALLTVDLRLEWVDEEGEEGEWQSTLSMSS